MIRFVRDWIDDRTGLGKVIGALLLEHIPGGAKWRYVWGSALAFVFMVQMVTGVLLMTAYSPSDTQAWNSVYFIQYEMDFGWLIRGLHHFGSQTMVVLMAVHMLQVVIAGAHLKPREVNWWLGLGLMGIILGLGLTGYLLPWDQKGFYATQVATNISGNIPVIGPFVQKVVVGGPEYGNHTLTRFYGLHVAIFPGLVIALLIAHVWVFRRHGVTHPRNARGSGWFWPDQAFRDLIVSLVVFAIMVGLVLYGWGNKVEAPTNADGTMIERTAYDKIAHAGRDGRGANLDAPADPDSPYPARPEWYFLFLFQLLKYFQGDLFLVGTLVIPGAVAGLLFVLPWLGYGKLRPVGHLVGVLVVVALIGAVGYLTAQAWVEDQRPATLAKQPLAMLKDVVAAKRYDAEKAAHFQQQMDEAEAKAQRAIQLAGEGIPAEGGRYLLRRDPMTKGKELFKLNCGICHSCTGACDNPPNPTASDLAQFGNKEWVKGILTTPDDKKYFGLTNLNEMTKWVRGQRAKAKDPKRQAELEADLDAIAEWLAGHPRQDAAAVDKKDPFAKGFAKFEKYCTECHSYRKKPDDEDSKGPDLTGYGDEEWLRAMIVAPNSGSRYGKKNRMPAFRALDGPGSELIKEQLERDKQIALKDADAAKKKEIEAAHRVVNLNDVERELIIRFLRKDGRVVFVGDTISGPPRKKE